MSKLGSRRSDNAVQECGGSDCRCEAHQCAAGKERTRRARKFLAKTCMDKLRYRYRSSSSSAPAFRRLADPLYRPIHLASCSALAVSLSLLPTPHAPEHSTLTAVRLYTSPRLASSTLVRSPPRHILRSWLLLRKRRSPTSRTSCTSSRLESTT